MDQSVFIFEVMIKLTFPSLRFFENLINGRGMNALLMKQLHGAKDHPFFCAWRVLHSDVFYHRLDDLLY